MKFSVLMTTYWKESSENLKRSIDSILFEQTRKPDQFVLVFDGPVGEELRSVAAEVEERFENEMRIVQLPENLGQAGASAVGLNHCVHPLLARMDSDDVSLPERFEKELRVFEDHPEVDVVGGWIGEFESDEQAVRQIRQVPMKNEEIRKAFRYRNSMNNVSVMMKKEIVERAGGYGRKSANEDYSLYIQMLIRGAVFYNLQEVLVKVRTGNGMASRRKDIHIFLDWVKDQKLLLRTHHTTVLGFAASCLGCLCFVVMPDSFKKLAYRLLLRRKA